MTYLYKAGLIDNMKHKTSTWQKHYLVKHCATQATMKYSMGLHNLFGNNTYGSERKLEEMSVSIRKVPQANFDAVLTYVENLFSVLSAESSESYSDDNLLRCLSGKMIFGERKKMQASGMIDNVVDQDDEDSNLADNHVQDDDYDHDDYKREIDDKENEHYERISKEIEKKKYEVVPKDFMKEKPDDLYVIRKQKDWLDRRDLIILAKKV